MTLTWCHACPKCLLPLSIMPYLKMKCVRGPLLAKAKSGTCPKKYQSTQSEQNREPLLRPLSCLEQEVRSELRSESVTGFVRQWQGQGRQVGWQWRQRGQGQGWQEGLQWQLGRRMTKTAMARAARAMAMATRVLSKGRQRCQYGQWLRQRGWRAFNNGNNGNGDGDGAKDTAACAMTGERGVMVAMGHGLCVSFCVFGEAIKIRLGLIKSRPLRA
jgi:hypothetical protein